MNKYENKINESNLLGDKFPHSLLVIEGVQELFRMVDGKGQSGKGNLAVNYFDSMLLRLNVSYLLIFLITFIIERDRPMVPQPFPCNNGD